MTTRHPPVLTPASLLADDADTIDLYHAQRNALDEATKAVALSIDATPATLRQIAFDVVRAYLRVMRQHEEKTRAEDNDR